jgi:hypothetical protein
VRFADVLLDLADELVVAVGLDDLAALAVDDLRHDVLLAVGSGDSVPHENPTVGLS